MADPRLVSGDPPLLSVPRRRRHLLALAAAYALLVTYGSLVPLDFQPMPSNRVAQRVDEVLHERLEFRSRSNLLVNVMLSIPLSFLLMAGFCADRSRAAALLAAPGVVLACVLFAASMEFLQLFFPPRVSSLEDVVLQGFGSCMGVLAWAFGGRATIDWCRRLARANTAPGLAGLLLPGYMILLILLHMAPFNLITRPKEVVVKWREGRIHPVPFQMFCENPIEGLDKTLINFAYFLPVGLFWGLGPIQQESRRRRILRAAATGLLAAGSVEVLQLMVYSRNFEATDILTGLLAVLVGAKAATAFYPPHDRSAAVNVHGKSVILSAAKNLAGDCGTPKILHCAQNDGVFPPPERLPAAKRSRAFLGLAILAWFAALMNNHWRPFDFVFDSRLVLSRLQHVEWLPLADAHHGNDFQAILRLLDRILLFVILGALFTLRMPDRLGRKAGLKVAAAVFVAALTLESGQLFLVSRHFGVSDILLGVLGGWLGFRLVAILTKLSRSPGAA